VAKEIYWSTKRWRVEQRQAGGLRDFENCARLVWDVVEAADEGPAATDFAYG